MTSSAPLTHASSPRLLAACVHASWFLTPAVGPLVAALVMRVRGRRDGFLRLHVQAALRVQLVAVVGGVLLLLVANTLLRTEDGGTNGLLFLLGGSLAVWASVVPVVWVVDAAEARAPRRSDPLTRALVPRTHVVPRQS